MSRAKSSHPIHYTLRLANPHAHILRVSMTVMQPDPAGQRFSLPTWIPGSYLIREFAKHIVTLQADTEAGPLPIHKTDKHSWQAAPCDGPLTLSYDIYAYDLSVRSAYFDAHRAFINGSSVFLSVTGQEHSPCHVDIIAPPGKHYQNWRVATALPRRKKSAGGAPALGFGGYQAPNYDALIDHPLEIGHFETRQFTAAGTVHHLIISGVHHADLDRLCADTAKICQAHLDLFGGRAPFGEYWFLLHVVGDGYGGLEHRDSTALLASRNDLPTSHEPLAPSNGYRQLLGLISHEYFHAWNVKRIKPAAYAPYDLSKEAYTKLLWAFEGITSYYDELMLVRSGVIPPEDYLAGLAETLTLTTRFPGNSIQTLEEASFDTWIKYYRPDENSPNAHANYYGKGGLVSWLLDWTLRQHTNKSLDDVMRALWQRYGEPFDTHGEGMAENAWERLASQISGLNLTVFFDTHLRTPSDVVSALLDIAPHFGVNTQRRAAKDSQDRGGKILHPAPPIGSHLGIRTSADPLGAKLTTVFTGSAAERAGLAAGDVLIALDHLRITHSNLDKQLTHLPPESNLTAHAFRRDQLLTLPLKLAHTPLDTFGLAPNPQADSDADTQKRYSAWLGSGIEK